MTREEQIREAATIASKKFRYRDMHFPAISGFVEGAEWADKNPKSPWISVEERLPEKDVLVIVKTGIGNCYLAAKDSVALPKDEFMLPQLCSYVDGVTHWMPIPELPKEG